MTLDQLIDRLTQIRAQNPGAQDVIVCTQSQGGIGAQAGVGVARVDAGFDWDQGRVLISCAADPAVHGGEGWRGRRSRPCGSLTPMAYWC